MTIPKLQNVDEEPMIGALAWWHPWYISSEWRLIAGRAEPISITIERKDGQPVTATAIRSMPVGEILAECRVRLAGSAVVMMAGPFPALTLQPGPQRGRGLSNDELQRVADVYRDAHRHGRSVRAAVAKDRNVAPSTATKRIMAARRAGLLEGIGSTQGSVKQDASGKWSFVVEPQPVRAA